MSGCSMPDGECAGSILDDKRLCISIIQSIRDGIVVLDSQGRIVAWNRVMEGYGIPASEVVGKRIVERFPTIVEEGIADMIETVLSGREDRVVLKGVRHRLQRGGIAVLDFLCYALPGSDRNVRGAVLISVDNTEAVERQRQAERSERLAAAGQLLAGIAHGIGTPLNVISGNAEYLLSRMDDGAEGRAELEIILSEAERIDRVMQQVLRMVRHSEPVLAMTDINALVEGVVRLADYQAESGRVAIETDLASDVPQIECDPNQLEQVIMSLVINAMQAMPQGGTLNVCTRAIAEGCAGDPVDGVEVSVSDTGCGIRPEDLERVFEPFFTTKAASGGTCLGLAMCRRIVSDHGGTISVSSTPGEGSTFTVWLPVRAAGGAG